MSRKDLKIYQEKDNIQEKTNGNKDKSGLL